LYLFGGAHRFSDHHRFGHLHHNNNTNTTNGNGKNGAADDTSYPINNPSMLSTVSVSVNNKWAARPSGAHIHYPIDARKDSSAYIASTTSVLSPVTTTTIPPMTRSDSNGPIGHGHGHGAGQGNDTSGRSSTSLPSYDHINDYSADLYMLDIRTYVWTLVPCGRTPLPRCHHTCDIVEGKLVVFGGRGISFTITITITVTVTTYPCIYSYTVTRSCLTCSDHQ
jgi:hypothetical protein